MSEIACWIVLTFDWVPKNEELANRSVFAVSAWSCDTLRARVTISMSSWSTQLSRSATTADKVGNVCNLRTMSSASMRCMVDGGGEVVMSMYRSESS